jgi:hypothetical protein
MNPILILLLLAIFSMFITLIYVLTSQDEVNKHLKEQFRSMK